jgi:hypothetical protein
MWTKGAVFDEEIGENELIKDAFIYSSAITWSIIMVCELLQQGPISNIQYQVSILFVPLDSSRSLNPHLLASGSAALHRLHQPTANPVHFRALTGVSLHLPK